MIAIDGSKYEGGGQIVRTAIALSAIKGIPVRIKNIRAGRETPGLKSQHFHSIKSAAEMCSADVKGLEIGSKEIFFDPKKISGGEYDIDIETAGSITLLLQLLTPIALCAESQTKFIVRGGTDVIWSPSSDYFKHVFLEFLKKFGIKSDFEVKRRGFYPKGNGEVEFSLKPWGNKKRVEALDRGKLEDISVKSIASESLRGARVSERQINGFEGVIKANDKLADYSNSICPGSVVFAMAEYKKLCIGAESIGKLGKRAEEVGRECSMFLGEEMNKEGIDKHLGDQIIPYIAVAGGKVRVSETTLHARTNAWVCNQFGYNVGIDNNEITS